LGIAIFSETFKDFQKVESIRGFLKCWVEKGPRSKQKCSDTNGCGAGAIKQFAAPDVQNGKCFSKIILNVAVHNFSIDSNLKTIYVVHNQIKKQLNHFKS
jgi:hypothetical protein